MDESDLPKVEAEIRHINKTAAIRRNLAGNNSVRTVFSSLKCKRTSWHENQRHCFVLDPFWHSDSQTTRTQNSRVDMDFILGIQVGLAHSRRWNNASLEMLWEQNIA